MILDGASSRKEREVIIDSLRSEAGGWSKESLKRLGVTWPPKKGWRKDLIKSGTQGR